MRRLVFATLAVFVAAVPWSVTPVPGVATTVARPYDFDGNGHPELVVGVPGMRINGMQGAGAVAVLPASDAGLSFHAKLISQSSASVPGASEEADFFGSSLASADFDGDRYADLAVGTWNESVGDRPGAGSVTVVYGSVRGLDTRRSAWIGQPGGAVQDANWGRSLVAGDFDKDGYSDLAVGAPGTAFLRGHVSGVGTVRVLPGSADGLRTAGSSLLGPEGGTSGEHTFFGYQLAAGDLDDDGFADLVVGAHGENQQQDPEEGPRYKDWSVSYCLGKMSGPSSCRQLVEGDEYSGLSDLAVGNISGDERPEITVGVPGFGEDHRGAVHILGLGTGTSITVTHRTTVTQNSAGVPGSNEADDSFGSSIAVADLDKDGHGDLLVAAPGENDFRGRVVVVHGASAGWRTRGNCGYSQKTRGVPGVAESGDGFGSTLTLLDHDRDGHPDLTVSALFEDSDGGAVTTLRGSSGCGFTTDGSRTFGSATLGYRNQHNEAFGNSLGRP